MLINIANKMPFIFNPDFFCISSIIGSHQYNSGKHTLKLLNFCVSLENIYGLASSVPFKYIEIMPTFSEDCEKWKRDNSTRSVAMWLPFR